MNINFTNLPSHYKNSKFVIELNRKNTTYKKTIKQRTLPPVQSIKSHIFPDIEWKAIKSPYMVKHTCHLRNTLYNLIVNKVI